MHIVEQREYGSLKVRLYRPLFPSRREDGSAVASAVIEPPPNASYYSHIQPSYHVILSETVYSATQKYLPGWARTAYRGVGWVTGG